MTDGDPTAAIRRAVAEVRREALKAAVVTATVDGVLAGLLVNALLSAVTVPVLPATVAGGTATAHVLAAVTMAGVAVGEYVRLTRRPAVERFEAANPAVREALRTARDTVEGDGRAAGDGRPGPVVTALHEEVLDRLRATSSRAFVPWRRLVVAVVLVAAVGGGTVGMAAYGVTVDPVDGVAGGGSPAATPAGGAATPSADLRSGDEVLGEETNVTAGSENVSADVGAGPGEQGERASEYDRSGLSGGAGDVDARRTGYTRPAPVEEADLIREYTLALQDDDDD